MWQRFGKLSKTTYGRKFYMCCKFYGISHLTDKLLRLRKTGKLSKLLVAIHHAQCYKEFIGVRNILQSIYKDKFSLISRMFTDSEKQIVFAVKINYSTIKLVNCRIADQPLLNNQQIIKAKLFTPSFYSDSKEIVKTATFVHFFKTFENKVQFAVV